MKRSFGIVGMTAVAATSAVFAFAAAAQADDVITLGASVQQTGTKANTGRYYRDAYQLAVDKINAAGGVKVGDKTYKLKLDILDNQSDVNLSVRQYVQLITLGQGELPARAVRHATSRFPTARSPRNTRSRWSRAAAPPPRSTPAATNTSSARCRRRMTTMSQTIDMLSKLDPAPKNVALVAADDSFDVSVAKGTRAHLKDAGLKLVGRREASATATASSPRSYPDQVESGQRRCDPVERPRDRRAQLHPPDEEPRRQPEASTPSPSACRPPTSARRWAPTPTTPSA